MSQPPPTEPPPFVPARRSRPTLGLLMLVVVAVAVPSSIVGTVLRSGARDTAVWLFAIWGLGILLVAVAIGAWWRHTAAQVLGQVILVTGLYASLFAIAELARFIGLIPQDEAVIQAGVVLAFAATVTLPLVLRRRALDGHPPGRTRERLLALAGVGLAAGLNLVVQIAYIVAVDSVLY